MGVGLLPLLILVGDPASPGPIQPAATAQTYALLAAIFGSIALAGLVWGSLDASPRMQSLVAARRRAMAVVSDA